MGLALATDAAIVSFALSLIYEKDSRLPKVVNGLLISTTFGLFQTVMLWLGSYIGYRFTFSEWGYYLHIFVSTIFFFMAVKCMKQSSTIDQVKVQWSFLSIIILALVTSFDALPSGISLGTVPKTHYAAIAVGMITIISCGGFFTLGHFLQKIPYKLLLRFAGIIFFFLGGQIFWSTWNYFFKG